MYLNENQNRRIKNFNGTQIGNNCIVHVTYYASFAYLSSSYNALNSLYLVVSGD